MCLSFHAASFGLSYLADTQGNINNEALQAIRTSAVTSRYLALCSLRIAAMLL